MGDKLRLHVAGLGSTVLASDLEKTFTSPQFGAVQSVEIIRSKGRSFAYLEFVPASDKGLAKLFSTYNGCKWKGGRLKLEKAKEDYISRLRREWLEDAQHETELPSDNVDADESVLTLPKSEKDQDIGKMQLNLFFPKLRKIKAIPLKGTGKHKYSFQRIEVPLLPIHFCDCEQHFVPPEPARRNLSGGSEPVRRNISGGSEPVRRNNTDHHEVDNCGVNEEELNMMKSILDKLLQKEIHSEIVPRKAEPSEEIQHDASLADKWQVDDNEEDQVSDEDDFVINIVGQSRKRVDSFEDWGKRTTITNQDTLVGDLESNSNTDPKMQGMKRANQIFDKKRKPSVREDKSNDMVPSKKKGRKGDSHDTINDQVVINTKAVVKEPESVQLSCDAASSNKSSWKALVSEKGSVAFSISDILMNHKSEVEPEPGSDLATEPSSNENNGQHDQTNQHEELEKHSDVQSTKPTASEDLLARGSSWKQKSSWLQLVADANASAFNLSQILPDVTFQKQELQPLNDIDFSKRKRGKEHISVDEKSGVEDSAEPQGPANKDIYANQRNPNEDVLTEERIRGVPVGEQSNPCINEKAEKEYSASMLSTNLVPSNRPLGEIVISETCPFMRSSASMKEWAKSKAALSGSHKKKGKEKESPQD